MKKSLVCLFALFVVSTPVAFARSYLGTDIPLTGNTMLPTNMQAVVLGNVYSKVAKNAKGCKKIMLSNTKVTKEKTNVEYNRNGKEIGGVWSEEWTVDACGYSMIVPVNFTTKGHGVKFEVMEPKY